MAPAFSSLKQATIFALLLGFTLLSPAFIRPASLTPREQNYSSIGWGTGSFPYLHDEIFEQTKPIDIAFMGTSRIWWGINTPQIETDLEKKVGHEVTVRTFGWNWPGLDRFYYVLRDLLAHRQVRMVVFPNCSDNTGASAHPRSPNFFRLEPNDNSMENLTLYSRISFYASTLTGLPRNLIGFLRPNLPVVPSPVISWPGFTNLPSPFLRLGSLSVNARAGQPFTAYKPPVLPPIQDVRIYSESTRSSFQFSNRPLSQLQQSFARKIGDLARQHNVQLVFLHLPQITETNSPVIQEARYWPDVFGTDVTMVGIAPAKLFAGIPPQDVAELYYNSEHFNQNGQEFYTSVVAPALVQIYESQIKH